MWIEIKPVSEAEMGGKSRLAVTFPFGSLPAPAVVNSGLTARDHISPEIPV
jgi:hypothetical protein